jgi:hypothetical protein
MTDEEFLRALDSCELPERDFGHAAHARAGYFYSRAQLESELARRVFLLPTGVAQ